MYLQFHFQVGSNLGFSSFLTGSPILVIYASTSPDKRIEYELAAGFKPWTSQSRKQCMERS
jgi:hypothetical protein